jgi:amidase
LAKVALRSEPWLVEPSLIELPWKPTVRIQQQKLRIGVMYHDAVVATHPPISRCLKSTAEAIERAGHTVVRWDPALHGDIVNCLNEFLLLDSGEEFLREINAGAEPLTPLSKIIVDRISPKPYSVRDTWKASPSISLLQLIFAANLSKLNMRRNSLQTAYANQWNDAHIDAILCPVGPSVASAHGESTYWGYTSVYNVLDYSAIVFPVGTVEKTDTWEGFPPEMSEPMSEEDVRNRAFYSGPDKYSDAPIALQLVTRRFKDEEAILIGEEICKIIDSRS